MQGAEKVNKIGTKLFPFFEGLGGDEVVTSYYNNTSMYLNTTIL